jgi:hypothetical protein
MFSEWRFVHRRANVYLPRTIQCAGNRENPQLANELDPGFREAAFESLDLVFNFGDGTYCADAIRTFERGA